MTQPANQIRQLIDSVEPVTAQEARDRAGASDRGAPRSSSPTWRRPALVMSGLVVVALVVLAIVAWPFGDDSSDPAGETVVAGPPPTVLPPVGDDPLVSCDPYAGEAFRPSAWSNPVGAEREDDPAAIALRDHLSIQNAWVTGQSIDPLVPLPESPWRRLAESPDAVLFGSGELDLDAIASDGMGPALAFKSVRQVDGTWQVQGTNAGSCNELWVQPPDGQSVAAWWFGADARPTPGDTTLTLQVGPGQPFCGAPVTVDELVGPDVVETEDSVTIRVALDRTPIEQNELGGCEPRAGVEEPKWVEVTVELAQPLGDRVVLDGGKFPAARVDLQPEPPEEEIDVPRIELDGGTVDLRVLVLAPCPTGATDCDLSPGGGAEVVLTAGNVSAQGTTAITGMLDAVVPAGYVEVSVRAEGLQCPATGREVDAQTDTIAIGCARTDQPAGRVSGQVAEVAGERRLLTFFGDESPVNFATVTGRDGSFEVTLPAGSWRVQVVSIDGVIRCMTEPRDPIEVEPDAEQHLELSCR